MSDLFRGMFNIPGCPEPWNINFNISMVMKITYIDSHQENNHLIGFVKIITRIHSTLLYPQMWPNQDRRLPSSVLYWEKWCFTGEVMLHRTQKPCRGMTCTTRLCVFVKQLGRTKCRFLQLPRTRVMHGDSYSPRVSWGLCKNSYPQIHPEYAPKKN